MRPESQADFQDAYFYKKQKILKNSIEIKRPSFPPQKHKY